MTELVAIGGPADEALVEDFHRGVYLAAFARQAEPVAIWKRRLWGTAPDDSPYRLAICVAGARLREPARELHGGIVYELYPRSRVGLMTYLAVAATHRRAGLGRTLIDHAIAALVAAGARQVLGEIDDPRGSDAAAARLARFHRWGARVIDARYIQPALAPGLARDRGLVLLTFTPPAAAHLDGTPLAEFFAEFVTITEGAPPHGELADIEHGLRGRLALR